MSSINIIIVLGGPLTTNAEPGIWLKSRLDKTIELYRLLQPTYIIVSGGDPNNIGTTEAFVMKEYLIQSNIPGEIIFTETFSSNTYENAIYSYEMIKHLSNHPNHPIQIYTITSDFHIERSKIIFETIFTRIPIIMVASVTPIVSKEYAKLEQNESYLIAKLSYLIAKLSYLIAKIKKII